MKHKENCTNSNIIVLVTQGVYEKGKAVFDCADEEGLVCMPVPSCETELVATVRKYDARHVILGMEKYTRRLYDVLPKGAVLARFGVGYDNIDLKYATEKGLFCTNTPCVLEDSVAEITVALMLSAARHIPEMNENTRKGLWTIKKGVELHGKRLSVIGCGQIGCTVARIVSAGFGMEVIGCEIRDVDEESMKHEYGFSAIMKDFSEAVTDADFVTLHIPSIPDTYHFINNDSLKAMPRKSWLINTARGAVVDENALYNALESGTITGAALDVFETEPYAPVDSAKDLRMLPNVIMIPHVGSYTVEASRRMAERALRNIVLAERKDFEKMDLLNPEVLSDEE